MSSDMEVVEECVSGLAQVTAVICGTIACGVGAVILAYVPKRVVPPKLEVPSSETDLDLHMEDGIEVNDEQDEQRNRRLEVEVELNTQLSGYSTPIPVQYVRNGLQTEPVPLSHSMEVVVAPTTQPITVESTPVSTPPALRIQRRPDPQPASTVPELDVLTPHDELISFEVPQLPRRRPVVSPSPSVSRINVPMRIPENIHIMRTAEGTIYRCVDCNRRGFKTKGNVNYHKYCAGQMAKPFKCTHSPCQREFQVKSHFIYHLRTHTGERPHICEDCGLSFYQRNKLERHRTCVHSSARLHVCQVCKKGFNDRKRLDVHLKSHTKLPFACGKCHKYYEDLLSLERHQHRYHGKKPFACHVCGTAFSRPDNRERHVRNIHGINGSPSRRPSPATAGRLAPTQSRTPEIMGTPRRSQRENRSRPSRFSSI